MPAPAKPSAGRDSLTVRLTRKVGPLPVVAWAGLILAAFLLYNRLHGGTGSDTSAQAQTTAAPVTASTAGDASAAQVPASGGGTPASSLSGDLLSQLYGVNAGTIDTLTNAVLTKQSLDAAHPDNGAPPGSAAPAGPAAAPTPPPVAQTAAAGHLSQSTGGTLKWGGVTFTTKAAFNSWAKAHGTTAARELANHPQARALYSTLR